MAVQRGLTTSNGSGSSHIFRNPPGRARARRSRSRRATASRASSGSTAPAPAGRASRTASPRPSPAGAACATGMPRGAGRRPGTPSSASWAGSTGNCGRWFTPAKKRGDCVGKTKRGKGTKWWAAARASPWHSPGRLRLAVGDEDDRGDLGQADRAAQADRDGQGVRQRQVPRPHRRPRHRPDRPLPLVGDGEALR